MLQTSLSRVQAVHTGATAENAARSSPSAEGRDPGLLSQAARIQGLPSRALLIGCNYDETKFALRGCINDVRWIQEMLIDFYGMQPESITTMTVRCTSPQLIQEL